MNFTHAAHDLNLTQPAVSQHIKYLEKEYDAPLFVRDKKKLALTPAVKFFAPLWRRCEMMRTL